GCRKDRGSVGRRVLQSPGKSGVKRSRGGGGLAGDRSFRAANFARGKSARRESVARTRAASSSDGANRARGRSLQQDHRDRSAGCERVASRERCFRVRARVDEQRWLGAGRKLSRTDQRQRGRDFSRAAKSNAAHRRRARSADRGIGGSSERRIDECRSSTKTWRALRAKRRSRGGDQIVSARGPADWKQRCRFDPQSFGLKNALGGTRDRGPRGLFGGPSEAGRSLRQENRRASDGEEEARRNIDRRSEETSGPKPDRLAVAF